MQRALSEIGFSVRSLLGRVVLANPPQMPPRTHRLLLVEVEGGRWIADVGFGASLTAPVTARPILQRLRRVFTARCMKAMSGRCSLSS